MRFRTLNPRTAANSVRSDLFTAPAKQPERISLSFSGGEGWGEEAVFSYLGGSWGGYRRLRTRERERCDFQETWEQFFISPRERAGVRGNGMRKSRCGQKLRFAQPAWRRD